MKRRKNRTAFNCVNTLSPAYADYDRFPPVLIVYGSLETSASDGEMLAARLRGTGIEVEQREFAGGHDWDFWNEALPQALDWLPRG